MADMADEAVGPPEDDVDADTAWERAFVTPETGSDFELGHRPRPGFFFEDQVVESPLALCPALLWCETVDVDDVDVDDANEEEEFDLWTPFRGMNIRDTSSAFIEVSAACPPLPAAYHPRRGPDCTLGGEATAVMRRQVLVGEDSEGQGVLPRGCRTGGGRSMARGKKSYSAEIEKAQRSEQSPVTIWFSRNLRRRGRCTIRRCR